MFLEGLVLVGVGMKRVFSGKAFGVRFPVKSEVSMSHKPGFQ